MLVDFNTASGISFQQGIIKRVSPAATMRAWTDIIMGQGTAARRDCWCCETHQEFTAP